MLREQMNLIVLIEPFFLIVSCARSFDRNT